jgi:hypothetical protein
MSTLEAEQHGAPQPVAPYRRGDRISVVSPEGVRFVAKVESVTPRPSGEFAILAAIREPRRYRSHLLTTTVDARGVGASLDQAV